MIYTASKTIHAPKWRLLRDAGWPIISTWIDNAEVGQTSDFDDLWQRCLGESAVCKTFLIYRELDEVLKGAWIELGVALTNEARVLAVGIEEFTIAKFSKIEHFPTVMDALSSTDYKNESN